MFSIKTDKWSSPLPLTLKVSVESVSSTFKLTSVSNSLYNLARTCLLVTNFPSLPANGELLTEKFIANVGFEILTNSIGSRSSSLVKVSPISIPSTPVKATIDPNFDSLTSTLFNPSNS